MCICTYIHTVHAYLPRNPTGRQRYGTGEWGARSTLMLLTASGGAQDVRGYLYRKVSAPMQLTQLERNGQAGGALQEVKGGHTW